MDSPALLRSCFGSKYSQVQGSLLMAGKIHNKSRLCKKNLRAKRAEQVNEKTNTTTCEYLEPKQLRRSAGKSMRVQESRQAHTSSHRHASKRVKSKRVVVLVVKHG